MSDWNVKAVDVTGKVDPLNLPCCPLCDNELVNWEEVAFIVASETLSLVHATCLQDLLDDD